MIIRLQEMVRTLQSEKLKMLSSIDHLENQNKQMDDELKKLKNEVLFHPLPFFDFFTYGIR
jgi:hypothetical protein